MKKIHLITVLMMSAVLGVHAQKISGGLKKSANSPVLAKLDNLTAELHKDQLYLFVNNKSSKDTIALKKFAGKPKPTDVKIVKFETKGTPLYSVTWNEVETTETKLKKEVATTVCTELCDVARKRNVLSNAQKTTNITEIVYLDKNQTVSETQEKVRREGMQLSLQPNGDVILKNKGQETRMIYDAAQEKYVNAPVGKKK